MNINDFANGLLNYINKPVVVENKGYRTVAGILEFISYGEDPLTDQDITLVVIKFKGINETVNYRVRNDEESLKMLTFKVVN